MSPLILFFNNRLISFVVSHFTASSAIPQMHQFLIRRSMRVTIVYSVTFIVDLHRDDPDHPNVFDAYYRVHIVA